MLTMPDTTLPSVGEVMVTDGYGGPATAAPAVNTVVKTSTPATSTLLARRKVVMADLPLGVTCRGTP